MQARAHKAAAEAAGARFIGAYEGDSHDIMSAGLKASAGAVALFNEWHEGPEHGAAIAAVAAGLKAIDPSLIMANYQWCAGGRTPDKPWIECAPWDHSGADDSAWRTLLKP